MNDERLEVREVPSKNERLEVREAIKEIPRSADGEQPLAIELLSMLKRSLTRAHRLIIILLVIIFANNLIWLYFWNLPSEETDTTTTTYDYDVNSEDGGNAVYNDSGEVNINGESEKDGN